jgi:hypothetical protein
VLYDVQSESSETKIKPILGAWIIMHRKNNKPQPMSAPVTDLVSQSLIDDINSTYDDPVGSSLEKRQPKKYSVVWIESLNRPGITMVDGHPEYGFLDIFMRKSAAQESLHHFRKQHRWNSVDLSIREMTLREAIDLCLGMPTPVQLVREMGVVKEVIAVLINGMQSDKVIRL